jgi:hypothetical protein
VNASGEGWQNFEVTRVCTGAVECHNSDHAFCICFAALNLFLFFATQHSITRLLAPSLGQNRPEPRYRQWPHTSLSPPKVRRPNHLLIRQPPPLPHPPLTDLPPRRIPAHTPPNSVLSAVEIIPEIEWIDAFTRCEQVVAQGGEGEEVEVGEVRDKGLQDGGS